MYFAEYYRWLVVFRYLRISGGDTTLLDVGCHDGYFLLQQRARLRVGLDRDPVPRWTGRVPLVQANALHPPLPPASFDTIFAFDLVEHVEDDVGLLKELVHLLAPGGTLWLSTPSAASRIWPPFLTARLHRSSGHVRNGYTFEELQQKLPSGCRAALTEWSEPFLRAFFVPLHFLSLLWPWLGHRATALCAWLDHFFPQGRRGHLFVRIDKPRGDPPEPHPS